MLTMSDTWKGAGCVKGGAFDLGIWTDLRADEITDHIIEMIIVRLFKYTQSNSMRFIQIYKFMFLFKRALGIYGISVVSIN